MDKFVQIYPEYRVLRRDIGMTKCMKKDNKKTGNRGEELACEFLEKKGYLIVERNFSTRFGELDIVCLDGEILVFVEVKTKIGHDFGEPEEMVSKSKLTQVQRMGEVYCVLSGRNESCRVDVVGIVLTENGEVEILRHHEAVY